MKLLVNGGFDVKLTDNYSPLTRHLISYAGKYIVLLAKEKIKPINSQQEEYIQAVKGEINATKVVEKKLILFMKEYPELVDSVLENYPSLFEPF